MARVEGDECECRLVGGADLILCLAPPEGEYEVHMRLGSSILVINRRGAFFRVTSHEEGLPVLTTFDRPVSLDGLIGSGRVDFGGALCEAVKGLREAAVKGSRVALERLERCRELVEDIMAGCP